MGRIAGQQDPPVAVPLGLPGLEPVARQPRHVLPGADPRRARGGCCPGTRSGSSARHRRTSAASSSVVWSSRTPEVSDPNANTPRSVRVNPGGSCPARGRRGRRSRAGHRIGHGDLGEPVDLWIGGAGERDAGQVADPAAARRRSPPGSGRSPGRARPGRAPPRSPWRRPGCTPTTSCPRRISAPSSRARSSSTRSSRGCGSCTAHSGGSASWVKSRCTPPNGSRGSRADGAALAASNRSSRPR